MIKYSWNRPPSTHTSTHTHIHTGYAPAVASCCLHAPPHITHRSTGPPLSHPTLPHRWCGHHPHPRGPRGGPAGGHGGPPTTGGVEYMVTVALAVCAAFVGGVVVSCGDACYATCCCTGMVCGCGGYMWCIHTHYIHTHTPRFLLQMQHTHPKTNRTTPNHTKTAPHSINHTHTNHNYHPLNNH